jgi:nucleoside-diphosphate-sugar epimerase
MDPDFCYTVIRPYVTYGDTRITFSLAPALRWTIAQRIKDGKPILLPNVKNTCTFTHADDFAVGFFGLCKNERAYGEAFHITSDFIHPWTDVADIIADYFGTKAKFEFRSIEEIARGMYPMYQDVYEMLKADKATSWIFDNSKLRSVVPEFSPKITLEEGMRRTLDYLIKHEAFATDEQWNETCDRIIYG